MAYFNWDKGLEIHHDGDLPARSGLGSSSSFTVGLINALSALRGNYVSKEDLANQGYFIRPSDEEAWELALSDPKRYADEEVESEVGECGPLPPEMLERWS